MTVALEIEGLIHLFQNVEVKGNFMHLSYSTSHILTLKQPK